MYRLFHQNQIEEEVKQCSFTSVQVDETTDVSTKEHLSVIIRIDIMLYNVVEGFLKLFNVNSDRTAPAISHCKVIPSNRFKRIDLFQSSGTDIS